MQRTITFIILAAVVVMYTGTAMATAISYQGRLDAGGQAFDGSVDMVFELFDAEANGSAIGSPVAINGVPVQQGLFQVELDFGVQPYDAGLWLQVSIEGQALSPRQRLSTAPLAVHSLTDATSAGTGLVLAGTELSVDPMFRLPQGCGTDQFARRASSGDWICADLEMSGYTGTPPVDVTEGVISLIPRGVDAIHITRGAIHDYEIAEDALINPAKIDGTAATLSGDQVFDEGTLTIETASGRVGVGTALPEATLDVRGDIRISGEILLGNPRTLSINVAGAAYTPTDIATEDDHLSTSEFGGYLYMGGNLDNPSDTALAADAVAPIELPAGATVTRLICHFYDSAATEDLGGTAFLMRRSAESTSASTMASVSLSTTGIADTNMQTNFDDTITAPAMIDPADYLWLRVRIQTGAYSGTSLRFYGCSVEYMMDSL
jgi:hypothetical protein